MCLLTLQTPPALLFMHVGAITMMANVSEGQKIVYSVTTSEETLKRLPVVTKQILRNQSLNAGDQVRGVVSVFCAANRLLAYKNGADETSGEQGMQAMAERMSETLDWAPSLAILAGPEFGHVGGRAAETANYMHGCSVWTSINRANQGEMSERAHGGGAVAYLDRSGTAKQRHLRFTAPWR